MVGRGGALVTREFQVDCLVHGPLDRSPTTARIRVLMDTAIFGRSGLASADG